MVTKHITVSGKVQGVFFRKNAKQKAEELNLYGWVKNTANDTVEILVQGYEARITNFIDWCKQGPPKAEVKDVRITDKEADNNLKDFLIVYED